MASTNTDCTFSSGSINYMRQMSSYAHECTRLDVSWSDLDPEQKIKQPLYQKRSRINIPTAKSTRKGIGFVEQFRGNRYPIGKKK